jgi:hypothetical protein
MSERLRSDQILDDAAAIVDQLAGARAHGAHRLAGDRRTLGDEAIDESPVVAEARLERAFSPAHDRRMLLQDSLVTGGRFRYDISE